MPAKTLKTLKMLTEQLPGLLRGVEGEVARLQERIRTLKRKGVSYASEHWRVGRYLYLIYPSTAGKARQREYVGTDPLKIEKAQQMIQRRQECEQLAESLDEIEVAVERCVAALSDVKVELERFTSNRTGEKN